MQNMIDRFGFAPAAASRRAASMVTQTPWPSSVEPVAMS